MSSRLFDIALTQYGVHEIPGKLNNPEVMKYYHDTGRKWVDSETTPWCDAFIDWCCWKIGLEFTDGLYARQWLEHCSKVESIEEADLVAYWRVSPDSWMGHISIPIVEREHLIFSLGGNQGDMVQISPYYMNRKLAYLKLP
ncbi:hypothetical protein LCGC14_2553640 [marine sediment metagenome]|uniref:NlpC/P60 domain-containing protein n=1 Tax=marine sediment metagenome TaxID=412755 RepID=A0A0F9CYB3_9ZZZZ